MARFRAEIVAALLALTFLGESRVECRPFNHFQKNTEQFFSNLMEGFNQFLKGLGSAQSDSSSPVSSALTSSREGRRASRTRGEDALTDDDLAWLEGDIPEIPGSSSRTEDNEIVRTNREASNSIRSSSGAAGLSADEEAWLNFDTDILDTGDEAPLVTNPQPVIPDRSARPSSRSSDSPSSSSPGRENFFKRREERRKSKGSSSNSNNNGFDILGALNLGNLLNFGGNNNGGGLGNLFNLGGGGNNGGGLNLFNLGGGDNGGGLLSLLNLGGDGGLNFPLADIPLGRINVKDDKVELFSPISSLTVDGDRKVDVVLPFIEVNVDKDDDGVNVKAPFTNVNTQGRDPVDLSVNKRNTQSRTTTQNRPKTNSDGLTDDDLAWLDGDLSVIPTNANTGSSAPETRVRTTAERRNDDGGLRSSSSSESRVKVKAPLTDVNVRKNEEVNVRAPFTSVDVIPDRSVRVKVPFVDFSFGEGGMTLNLGR